MNVAQHQEQRREAIERALGTRAIGRLVDIGTGTGRMIELFGPLAAQAIGTPATVIAGGGATLAIVGVWLVAFPSLRRIDRFEELHPDPIASTA